MIRRRGKKLSITKKALGPAIELLRSKGGSMYLAEPFNRVNSDGSGAVIGGSSIGYVRDLAMDELGPELNPNATAAAAMTGWTSYNGTKAWDEIEQAVLVTASSSTAPQIYCSAVPVMVGGIYELSVEIKKASVANASAQLGGSYKFAGGANAPIGGTTYGGWQVARLRVISTGATVDVVGLIGANATVGDTFYVRKLSVRQVNAAYQTTAGFKPILKREPILGPELAVNGDCSARAAGYGCFNGTIPAASGEVTCTATSVATEVNINQAVTLVTGKTYRFSAQVKNGNTSTGPRIEVTRGSAGGWAGLAVSSYNATTSYAQLSVEFTATGPGCIPKARATSTAIGQTFTMDNWSVREITGYKDVWSWGFDGMDDLIRARVSPITGASGALLCVALCPLRAPASADSYMFNKSPSGSGGGSMFISGEPTRVAFALTDGTNQAYLFDNSAFGNALGTWRVYTLWRDGDLLRVRKNGTTLASVSATLISPFAADRTLIVGSNWGGVAGYNPAGCQVQGPVVSQGITTLSEVQTIERAVAAAAGVTLP